MEKIGEADSSEGVAEIEVFSRRRVERLDPVKRWRTTEHATSNKDVFGSVFDGGIEARGAVQVKSFRMTFGVCR